MMFIVIKIVCFSFPKFPFFSDPYPLVLRESKMYGNFIVKLCKALDHHFNESTHSLPFSGLCTDNFFSSLCC